MEHREIDFEDIKWKPIEMIKEWCEMSYPRHPHGCPNVPGCRYYRWFLPQQLRKKSRLFLVWIEFDLDAQAIRMKAKHPTWTEAQCRNLLYWQKTVRRDLREGVRRKFRVSRNAIKNYLYEGAEGGGVDFYLTMRGIGIYLDRMNDLHTVRVIGIFAISEPQWW